MVSLQDFQALEPFDGSSHRSDVTVSVCHVDADPLTLLRWRTTGGTSSSLSPAVLYYHRSWWHFRDKRCPKGPSSPFPLLCHQEISVKEEEMIFLRSSTWMVRVPDSPFPQHLWAPGRRGPLLSSLKSHLLWSWSSGFVPKKERGLFFFISLHILWYEYWGLCSFQRHLGSTAVWG